MEIQDKVSMISTGALLAIGVMSLGNKTGGPKYTSFDASWPCA